MISRIRQYAMPVFMLCVIGALDKPAHATEYELPQYDVVEKDGDFEIREYAPQLVAEITMGGERCDAATRGFRVLADFIFGNNSHDKPVNMTAPVVQEEVQRLAGRSLFPVNSDEDVWIVRFMMPSEFTQETLPKPDDERIHIATLPGHRTVSVTFTGLWTDSNLEGHFVKLQQFIADHKLQTTGKPVYAFYDDPFTWPWSRRNEIIVTLAPESRLKTPEKAQ